MRTAKHPERADRLLQFLKEFKIKNVELSKRMGLAKATYISQLLNKRTTVTADAANRIAAAYPVLNVNWLLFGKGEMKLSDNDPASAARNATETEHNESEEPLDGLKRMLQDYGRRIMHLEEEMRLLKEGRGYESRGEKG